MFDSSDETAERAHLARECAELRGQNERMANELIEVRRGGAAAKAALDVVREEARVARVEIERLKSVARMGWETAKSLAVAYCATASEKAAVLALKSLDDGISVTGAAALFGQLRALVGAQLDREAATLNGKTDEYYPIALRRAAELVRTYRLGHEEREACRSES